MTDTYVRWNNYLNRATTHTGRVIGAVRDSGTHATYLLVACTDNLIREVRSGEVAIVPEYEFDGTLEEVS